MAERSAVLVENSPREVTDSSAEISDLAKRFGARLYHDASLVDQLRNVNREKSFVEQLRDLLSCNNLPSRIVNAASILSHSFLVQLAQAATICKEIDVQTSIRVTELPVLTKELRDNATDVPNGTLTQLLSTCLRISVATYPFLRRSLQPRKMCHRLPSALTKVQVKPLEAWSVAHSHEVFVEEPAGKASPRTPRVSESPWRPSSRRLHLEEVDISTSQETDSIEVISVSTPQARRRLVECSSTASRKNISDANDENGVVEDEHSTKESSDSSHQDEEHTYNQVSQIASE
ncbi:hypothetical protein OSTOST_03891 [Ostertagia ostertagi]